MIFLAHFSLSSREELSLDDIYAVELVGGSTRIPAVKGIVEQVFGKTVNTTLNQDEAVSRGAALQCAILSPAVRVHDFATTDIQNYAVSIAWDGSTEMQVFEPSHPFPFSRMITLNRREPFYVQLHYTDPHLKSDPLIGKCSLNAVSRLSANESSNRTGNPMILNMRFSLSFQSIRSLACEKYQADC